MDGGRVRSIWIAVLSWGVLHVPGFFWGWMILHSRIDLIWSSVTQKIQKKQEVQKKHLSNILKSRIFPYQKLYRCKTTEVRTNGQKELSRNVLVLCPTVCKCRVNSGRDMLNSYIIKKKFNDAQVSTDTPEMVQVHSPKPEQRTTESVAQRWSIWNREPPTRLTYTCPGIQSKVSDQGRGGV